MMKTVVVSDIHLKSKFDKQKFNFLQKIFSETDQIIINGDFFDGYFITFDTFINSQWKNLFPILKEKRTVYIYGNHDKKIWLDGRTKLFSEKTADRFTLPLKENLLVFEHGDQLLEKSIAERFPILINPFSKAYIRMHLHMVYSSKYFKSFKLKYFNELELANKTIKQQIKALFPQNHIYVAGHVHLAEYSPENNYINTGFIDYGQASYLEIENDKMNLIKTTY